MLGIGFKLSDTAPSALGPPLRTFATREFETPGAALSPSHEDALDRFLQLKADVNLVRTPSTLSRHVLLRYVAQLQRLEARVESVGSSTAAQLQLPFSWYDSFCPRKQATQPSLAFERAAAMFNYGALASQLGVQTDRSEGEGLKAACKHFMQAAGAFSAVKDQIMTQSIGPTTPDMSAEGLGLLIDLMLAQAQACFYEKAIKDQMKDGIKAKLVHQALAFYVGALDYCNSSALNGTIDRTWSVHVLFQVHCMKAAMQYWQAKASKEAALARGIGYGEEIARLMASDAECQEAIKVATQQRLPASLLQSARALQRVVLENLQAAQKDNASVYLENVPKFTDLPAIGKAAMVRPMAPTDEELAEELNGVDLFESFVPNLLQERATAVKNEVYEMLQAATARVTASNDQAKQQLHTLGLPASIEAFEKTSDNGIPMAIWQKIQHIQTTNRLVLLPGGENAAAAFMRQRLLENQSASDSAEKKLHGIETRMADEEIEDNVCRQNYGDQRWPRPLSSDLNQGFRMDVDRFYRLAKEAKQSDEIVRDKLNANAVNLELLAHPKAALDAQLPALQQEHSSCKQEIDALSTLLLRLGHLVDEKDQIVHDFSASYEKFNALPVLLSSGDSANVDAALESEKRFFQDHFVGKIETVCAEEAAILREVETANSRFEGKLAHDSVMQDRKSFLQQLSDGVDVFEQLQSHVKEGNKFYEELRVRIDQLHQTVEDHCAAREIEKRELELRIKTDDELKQRGAADAALAQQMMSNMSVREDHSVDDAALARQLAGDVPQYFQPGSYQFQQQPQASQQQQPPPSYDYARMQSQPHPYTQYEQIPGRGYAAPPTAPAPPAYANYYSQPPPQQQQQQQQQRQQPPPPAYDGYQQYPGAQYGTRPAYPPGGSSV